MQGKCGKFGLLVMLAVMLIPAAAAADVFMKEKTHTDGMTIMGQVQPAQDRVSTTWITSDKMRTDQGDSSTIAMVVDGKLVLYHLNHANKSYSELTVGSDGTVNTPPGMPGEMKVKVTPTSETRKIGNWNCRKYLQEMDMGMMPMTSEVWASEEVKMPYADFYEKLSMAMIPGQHGMGMASKAMMEEMKKVRGVPVLTVTNMTMMKNVTIKSSRELLEIREGTAPAGTFEIPAGYTKRASMTDFSGRKLPKKPQPTP